MLNKLKILAFFWTPRDEEVIASEYVAEDGMTVYTTEDSSQPYVTETA